MHSELKCSKHAIEHSSETCGAKIITVKIGLHAWDLWQSNLTLAIAIH